MNSRVFYTLIRLAVVCAALGLAAGCDDVSTAELKTPVYKTGLKDSDDNKTSAFRKDFPLQAASYDRNNESTFMSKYKGSVNFMKNDDVDPLPEGYKQAAQPYLKNLWLGYPFMYEYREARGHTYAIHDILEIDRINRYGEKGGMPATAGTARPPRWCSGSSSTATISGPRTSTSSVRKSRTTIPSAARPATTPKPCSSSSTASRSRII